MTVQLLSHLQVQTSEQKPSLPRGTAGRGEWRSKSCTPWHVVLKMARAHQTPKISFLPALRFNNVIKHLLALQQHWVRRPSLPLDSNETLQNAKVLRRTHEQLLTEIITTLSYNTAPPATCLLPALSTSSPFTTPSWFALAMGKGTTCSACARLTTATCSLLRVLPHPREGQTHARWSREQDEPFNSSQPRHLSREGKNCREMRGRKHKTRGFRQGSSRVHGIWLQKQDRRWWPLPWTSTQRQRRIYEQPVSGMKLKQEEEQATPGALSAPTRTASSPRQTDGEGALLAPGLAKLQGPEMTPDREN